MKKWVFWAVILLLVGYEALHQNKEVNYNTHGAETVRAMTGDSGGFDITVLSKNQIYQGNLLLVNKDYPVHNTGVTPDIVNLFQHHELTDGYGLLNNKIMLSQKVAEKFSAMIEAAGRQGVSHFLISSGYRGKEEQERLYEEKGAEVALPAGHSEHNLGLSLDIGSTQMEMNNAPEGQWLEENAWDYGFILRYPQDKTDITGIQYEPWHFRYVGLPHSIIMRDKNLTLEEYLEFLKKEKNITAAVDGRQYQISYVPVTGNTPFTIPAGRHYEVSGNNMDGVIVTVYHDSNQ